MSWMSGVRRPATVVALVAMLTSVAWTGPSMASSSPGDLDLGFGGKAHGRVGFDLGDVTGVAVQPHGGIVIVGEAGSGTTRDAVAVRFNADGTRDSRFGKVKLPGPTDAREQAVAAVAQPDSKVVVVGQVTDLGGFSDMGVWRLRPSGHLDTSFGGGDGFVQFGDHSSVELASDVAIDAKGRVLVAGVSSGTDPDMTVVRMTPAGALDATFNNGLPYLGLDHAGLDSPGALALQSDGKILLAGLYQGAGGYAVLRIAPGSASTPAALDGSFGANHDGIASLGGGAVASFPPSTDVAARPDGHILFLDEVPSASGTTFDASVVRLTSSGVIDPSFGSSSGAHINVPGATTSGKALSLLPHGRVAVVGNVDSASGGGAMVAELDSGGHSVPGMGLAGVEILRPNEGLTDVAVQSDGRIVVVGNDSFGDHMNAVYRLRGGLRSPTCGGKKATIVGTKAADKLVGTNGPDVIAGLRGGDTITGLGKGDIVCGGAGSDHLSGGAGGDTLYGGAGRDTLIGGPGHDTLRGGPGRDTLKQ